MRLLNERFVAYGLASLAWVATSGSGCAPRTEIGIEAAGTGAMPADGGTAGTSGTSGNGGTSGKPPMDPDCFDLLAPGGEATLEHSPNNAVFLDPVVRMVVENYAGQTVFSTPSWELLANFPESDEALNTMLDLPDGLDQVSDNVGEILIARPVCAGQSTAGRTIRVHAHWQLDGAIVWSPTEGVALGTTDGASFSDASIVYTRGEPDTGRPLNRLNPLVLEHTFDDDVDATTLVLRLWLLDEFAFPSTFYVNRIEWE